MYTFIISVFPEPSDSKKVNLVGYADMFLFTLGEIDSVMLRGVVHKNSVSDAYRVN